MPEKKAVRLAPNSRQIVTRVAADLNCSLGEADRWISLIAQVMAAAVKRGETVTINGIGNIHSKVRAGHMHWCINRGPEWQRSLRVFRFHPLVSLLKLVNEDYLGPDTLEELYAKL